MIVTQQAIDAITCNSPVLNMYELSQSNGWIELEASDGCVERLTLKHEYNKYVLVTARGKHWPSSLLMRVLRSPGLVALRVHDGVHTTGFCVFSFRGINIVGRFV